MFAEAYSVCACAENHLVFRNATQHIEVHSRKLGWFLKCAPPTTSCGAGTSPITCPYLLVWCEVSWQVSDALAHLLQDVHLHTRVTNT